MEDSRCEVFEDFRGGFGKWIGTGAAFGDGPVNGFAHSGAVSDKLVGILISREFVIKQRYIHVRLAGKSAFRLFADEYTNSGRVVTGGGDEFVWKTIDARMGQGNLAYLALMDLGRDSYLAVDQIVFSDEKRAPGGPLPDGRGSVSRGSVSRALVSRGSVESSRGSEAMAKKAELEAGIPESTFVLAAVDDQPRDVRIHLRGNHANLGAVAPRRFLTVLSGEAQAPVAAGSGREALADRMLADAGMLVARVMVNRVWRNLFGRGLVECGFTRNLAALGTIIWPRAPWMALVFELLPRGAMDGLEA